MNVNLICDKCGYTEPTFYKIALKMEGSRCPKCKEVWVTRQDIRKLKELSRLVRLLKIVEFIWETISPKTFAEKKRVRVFWHTRKGMIEKEEVK